ncbi:MAG: hypothetical protein AAB540_05000 [Patescibacteria group bacterium]|mgnify:CR=1 FL=1
MAIEENKSFEFKSRAEARTAFELVTGEVKGLSKEWDLHAKFSTPTGSRIDIYVQDTQVLVRLTMGPGITTPSQVIRSTMSAIETALSNLA